MCYQKSPQWWQAPSPSHNKWQGAWANTTSPSNQQPQWTTWECKWQQAQSEQRARPRDESAGDPEEQTESSSSCAQTDEQARCTTHGVKPQQQDGIECQGTAPTTRKALRRDALKCMPSHGLMPCPTSVLYWCLGPDGDPEVQTKVSQIKLWLDIWVSSEKKEEETDR